MLLIARPTLEKLTLNKAPVLLLSSSRRYHIDGGVPKLPFTLNRVSNQGSDCVRPVKNLVGTVGTTTPGPSVTVSKP